MGERPWTLKSERRHEALPAREVIYAAVGLLRAPVVDRRGYRELLTVLAEGPPSVAVEVDGVGRRGA